MKICDTTTPIGMGASKSVTTSRSAGGLSVGREVTAAVGLAWAMLILAISPLESHSCLTRIEQSTSFTFATRESVFQLLLDGNFRVEEIECLLT